MLTDRMITLAAASEETFRRGYGYYISGRVKKLYWEKKNNVFRADVMGSEPYSVTVELFENDAIYNYYCNCQAFIAYDGACKHIVASLKAIQDALQEPKADVKPLKKQVYINPSTRAFLDFFKKSEQEQTNQRSTSAHSPKVVRIVPKYCFTVMNGKKSSWIEFSVGEEKLYVMKDISAFVEATFSGRIINYGKNFEYNPKKAVFDNTSTDLLELLKEAFVDEESTEEYHYSYYNRSSVFKGRNLALSNSNLIKFFELMKEESFEININHKGFQYATIIEGRPNFNLDVSETDGGIKISLDLAGDMYFGLDAGFRYIYHKGLIYKVDSVFSSFVQPLMNCFNENLRPEVVIPEAEEQSLLSAVIPNIEKIASVKVSKAIVEKYYKEELEPQVYFDKHGDGISAKVNFKYGEQFINPLVKEQQDDLGVVGKVLLRNTSKEFKVLDVFYNYMFDGSKDSFIQQDEDDIFQFMREGLSEVMELSEVFYSEDFKNINIKKSGKISAGVRINTNNLLEMSFQYEDMDLKELLEMLASYKKKKKYHRLKSGQFLSLDSEDFVSAAEIIEQLNINHDDLGKDVIILPKYRAMYIDSLTREKAGVHLERSGAFKKMIQDITEPQDMEFELPKGIQGKLRDYQKIGFKWLKTLSYYGFGGILADDMGLGKTLQVLVFVKAEKDAKIEAKTVKTPCLVVAPTSLVYNWQEEVKKFAPSLVVTVLSGQQSERRERFIEIANSDIVVTSYGMIKRDIELYKDLKFEYCFIDEAQHIKNPNTQNAKAVKLINAKGFFALTGTPIENTLTELWSIFDFIMPGYLLSHNKFMSKFETPIVKNGNRETLKELSRHIKPFIMRRMKKDVLLELPEKIESKMSNEMTEEQKKVYAGYLLKAKKEFEQEISSAGFENSRIKILALLTRLRQVCCHPSLFIENYHGGSGKLEMLLELLEGAIDGGHRILLFSQFTSMLSLIKLELDKMKVKYHYLDGSTSAEERMRLVNTFNAGENDVFLISLKAGGTGLNLTGADMVIHYDPWWNPAVEDQATDRAYRIGQKNAVQVFKLITKDTIEEKIFALQQKKKELVDSVIKPGENFITKMSEDEIRKLFEM